MIHIKRSTDKKYYVTVVGSNNEVLSTSETLNSKQKSWKNIIAQSVAFDTEKLFYVKDETFKKTVTYIYYVHSRRKIKVS